MYNGIWIKHISRVDLMQQNIPFPIYALGPK